MDNKIAILILFFNKLEETLACIESFIPSKQAIYVLNNGSDVNLWNNIQQRFGNHPQITLFHSDTNLGVSKGRNYLIERTTEPWVLIIDNDTIVKHSEQWLSKFTKILKEKPNGRVFTLRIYNVHENAYVKPIKVVEHKRKVTIETTEEAVTNCFPCTGSIIHRSIFKTFGLFDESLFVFEDYEFAIRCMHSPKGALKVFHVNDIELLHDHKLQKAKVDKNAVKERYNEERIRESHNSIVMKFNIEFDHNWEWWTRKQVAEMTGGNLIAKIKGRVVKALRLLQNK